jgi:glucosamine kinase
VPYYLGIDGGGTKTTCAVGDDSRLLATATAGGSNIVRGGEEQARESLQQSVRQACAAAGITPAQVTRTCVGGSGAARPELAAMVRSILAEILSSPIDVVGDMEIALEAAFDTSPGVVVNAGTGSFAYGRDRHGNTARAGGWGFAIGDEGSAHWIGRAAVSAVLRASDPRDGTLVRVPHVSPPLRGVGPRDTGPREMESLSSQDTPLAAALRKSWGVASLSDLARAANSIPPPDFAALFPAVAASEDALALQVLSSAGRELAQIAALISHRLFPPDETQSVPVAMIPVAMIGSVFRHAVVAREAFYNELRRLDPRAEIVPAVVDPVEGALKMARRQCGTDTPVRRS